MKRIMVMALAVLVVIGLLATAGCSGKQEGDRREEAQKLFEQGQFGPAKQLLIALRSNYPNDKQLLDLEHQCDAKIAEQKYSLISLLSFMKNYYSDPMVVFYTKKLKYLNRWFDTFDIYYQPGDITVDTLRQVITTTGTEMTVTVDTLDEIRDYVAKLRAEITAV